MNKTILFFMLLASMSIFSCNESKPDVENVAKETPDFVGAWELIKMDLNGEIVRANILGDPTYSFNIDNTYVIRASSQFEQGTWTTKGENLVLYSKELEKETVIKIIENTENTLTYKIGEETISTVYLRRASKF